MDRREPTLAYGQERSAVDLILGRILDAVDVLEIRDTDGGFRATIVIMGTRFDASGTTPKLALQAVLAQAEGSLRVNQAMIEGVIKWLDSQ